MELSQLRGSLAICDHTVLTATRQKWTHSALNSAKQVNARFTSPKGWKAEFT